MKSTARLHRRTCMMLGIIGALLLGFCAVSQEPQRGGTLRIATTGDPRSLDLMVTTAEPAGTIGQHIFETLFAFDESFKPVPYLAESCEYSSDRLSVTFHLRKGVLFHNGEEMTADDVIASLQRWGKYGSRGVLLFEYVAEIQRLDDYTFVIRMSAPFGPMENLLALITGGPAIYPKSVAETATGTPISPDQYIGTGPYKFAEWVPGDHMRLVRFDGYKPYGTESSGLSGARIAYLDELVFVPVPEAVTRVAGVRVGDYGHAENIPGDLYAELTSDPRVYVYTMQPPIFPLVFLNTSAGLMANMSLRQAMLAALDMEPILQAGYGSLYGVNGCVGYRQGMFWYTDAGTDKYNQANPDRAQELAKAAGYRGERIRFMSTTHFAAHYNMALVMTSQWQKAGFNIDLQIYDWATLSSRRSQPEVWDAFLTHSGPVPDPALISQMSPTYPGWWSTDQKTELTARFNGTTDASARYGLWEELQALWYEEVPSIKLGDGYSMNIASEHLKGLDDPHHPPLLSPYYWNLWIEG